MKKLIILTAAVSSLVLAKPIVSTTIMPTKFFIEQIAGNELEINVMVPSSADPHTFEPKPSQMKMLEKSDLYFLPLIHSLSPLYEGEGSINHEKSRLFLHKNTLF